LRIKSPPVRTTGSSPHSTPSAPDLVNFLLRPSLATLVRGANGFAMALRTRSSTTNKLPLELVGFAGPGLCRLWWMGGTGIFERRHGAEQTLRECDAGAVSLALATYGVAYYTGTLDGPLKKVRGERPPEVLSEFNLALAKLNILRTGRYRAVDANYDEVHERFGETASRYLSSSTRQRLAQQARAAGYDWSDPYLVLSESLGSSGLAVLMPTFEVFDLLGEQNRGWALQPDKDWQMAVHRVLTVTDSAPHQVISLLALQRVRLGAVEGTFINGQLDEDQPKVMFAIDRYANKVIGYGTRAGAEQLLHGWFDFKGVQYTGSFKVDWTRTDLDPMGDGEAHFLHGGRLYIAKGRWNRGTLLEGVATNDLGR
jgi:hypothetical protein